MPSAASWAQAAKTQIVLVPQLDHPSSTQRLVAPEFQAQAKFSLMTLFWRSRAERDFARGHQDLQERWSMDEAAIQGVPCSLPTLPCFVKNLNRKVQRGLLDPGEAH